MSRSSRLPVGYSVVAVDPGTVTGMAWAVVGRSELRRLGVVGALGAARKDGRLLGEEVKGGDEFDSASYILSWLEVFQGEARRRTQGRVRGHHSVIIEDFILREHTKDRSLLAPVRLTAMVEFGLKSGLVLPSLHPVTAGVVRQSPSDAKSGVTDDRLRSWGLWWKGSPHIRDAIRHLVVYLRRHERELLSGGGV